MSLLTFLNDSDLQDELVFDEQENWREEEEGRVAEVLPEGGESGGGREAKQGPVDPRAGRGRGQADLVSIDVKIEELHWLVAWCRDEVERMFENKDKDLDGRLSFEEFMGEESRAERLFRLMDKDGDGYVTKHVSIVVISWYLEYYLEDRKIE